MVGPENWDLLFSFLQLRETYLGTKHSPKTGRGKPLKERELYSKRFFVEIYRAPVPFVMLILEKKMLRTEKRYIRVHLWQLGRRHGSIILAIAA
jgi:hypothetical protein